MEDNKDGIGGINRKEEHEDRGNRDGVEEIPNRVRANEQIDDGLEQSEMQIEQQGNREPEGGAEGGERGEHAPATNNGGRVDEEEGNNIGINKREEISV